MSNKKKSKRPVLGGEIHSADRKISREMKKLKQKNHWNNKK